MITLLFGGLLLVAVVAAAAGLSARSAADAELGARADGVRALVTYRLHHSPSRTFKRALEQGAVIGESRVQLVTEAAAQAVTPPPGARTFRYPLGTLGTARVSLMVALGSAPVADATRRAVIRSLILGGAALMLLLYAAFSVVKRDFVLPLASLQAAAAGLRRGGRSEPVPMGGCDAVRALGGELKGLAGVLADLESQAATDPLTGVANRRHFHTALETELARADRQSTPLALVLLDLDGFKQVNDTHGHPFGDGILQTLAERLRGTLRATDVLARVGGDEFAIILPGLSGERAIAIVERSRESAGVSYGGVDLTWRAGVAAYPADATDADTLLECADAALYCAKSAPQAGSCVYDPNERRGSHSSGDRAAIEALLGLPDAIVPVYQPLVSLSTGHVAGYEALARFPHPPARRPDEWFALAHGCGLGAELEARAVSEALAAPGRPAGTYLSFNLSASTLGSEEVLAVLPADLGDIVIEITENERVLDDGLLIERLAPLRARGARVAVDDAGAGYSGLQQVMRIQPDIIKLDRSLVGGVDTDPAKAALIDSFVRFARRTDAVVCAEGIETADELKVLADLDVSFGQGFGLARPAPPWARPSAWVTGTIRPRALHAEAPGSVAAAGQENGDLRLAHLTSRLANVRSLGELARLAPQIAAEIGAGDVALLMRLDGALECLTDREWMAAGRRLSLSHYPTIRRVISEQDVVQVLISDPTADLGELALLGQSHRESMMLAPIVSHGEAVGILQCFDASERPWTRSEVSRARIVAHQLGPLVEGLCHSASLTVVGDAEGGPATQLA
ncbi:MAG: hypothetical protein NVSMB25_16650 [Thermoleophilaceae bacterium]